MSTSYVTRGGKAHMDSMRWHFHDGATPAEQLAFMHEVLAAEVPEQEKTAALWLGVADAAKVVELVDNLDPAYPHQALARLDSRQATATIVLARAAIARALLNHFGPPGRKTVGRSDGRRRPT